MVLQYKPSYNMLDSLNIISDLLYKNNIRKETLVVCPELSLQDYICLTKDRNNINKAISLQSKIIEETKKIKL